MKTSVNFTLLITAPAFGSPGAYSAYQFCKAALAKGHTIAQIFFYGAGVYNANELNSLADDETNLTQLWQSLAQEHGIKLYVCIAAAQRRGVSDQTNNMPGNLAEHFIMTGLGQLVKSVNNADRFITFN